MDYRGLDAIREMEVNLGGPAFGMHERDSRVNRIFPHSPPSEENCCIWKYHPKTGRVTRAYSSGRAG